MEADWDEVTRIALPPPGVHALPTPVSAIAFDTGQELLWAGNEYGRMVSFYGLELQKYTSYKAHPSTEAVKQILFCDKGVISLSPRSIHLASRRGLTIWHLSNEKFKDLRCMSFASKGTQELLVAGCQSEMFKIDTEKGTIVQTLPAEAHYTLMKRGGQYICSATPTGSIHLLDPSTFANVREWKTAHSGGLTDMDARSDFLVTCGWSPRPSHHQQHGGPVHLQHDPLANVFDLKTLVPLPPINFPGAAFVRMHPRMSTTGILASITGQMQVIDIMNPNTIYLRQANVYDTQITALELAPSGDALAITDGFCQIHLWGSPAKMQFTEYSNPTEFPDTVAPPPSIEWSAKDEPLNKVGMPYYRETLLSAWPSHMVYEVGAPAAKIDPALLASLKRSELGGFAPNPRKTLRNQVANTRVEGRGQQSLVPPKFLSEKAREMSQDSERRMSDAIDAFGDMVLDGATKKDVPVMYRNVEIKYSKFGVDDFDFEYYNKTTFSGLETHITNSYANPLLQLYRFIPLVRNLSLQHAATSCLFENCLMCEMGFLVDMLEKAGGGNCQATNFLRTFSCLSSASSLGLLEEHTPNTPLTVMIQSLNRFLLDKLATDFRQMSGPSPEQSHMDYAITTVAMTTIRCAHCLMEIKRPGTNFVHDLVYPPKPNRNNMRSHRVTFSQVLKASVERQEQTRGWCDRCKRYQLLNTRKSIERVPDVLMINAAVHSPEAKQLWSMPNWLPAEIGIIVDKGQFFCYEGQDLKLHIQRGVYNIQVYELVGVVADINSGENQKPHLVSVIDGKSICQFSLAPSSRDVSATSQWHLFNDFLVRSTTQDSALRFDPSWKVPSVLAYQAKAASHAIDDSWKENLDPSLLYRRWSASQEENPDRFHLLSPTVEAPRPGTPVAIDAEFVALQREEIEIKADGTRETIRPSRLGLARVSVLRGAGLDEGLPFIDDYIAISEPVVDYLTTYSGIHPGDLDRNTSRHTLVSLKVAYKKLFLLLNLGCVFVGHGLLKDFRTINIHVPRSQVVDTVDLFFIPARQRKLNLRFLAYLILREDIQMEEHDSVEDARTALRLWRKYEEFCEAGVLVQTLNWVYQEGRGMQFRAPGAVKQLEGAAVKLVDGGGGGSSISGSVAGSSTSGTASGRPDTAGGFGAETPEGGGTPRRGAAVPFGRGAGPGFGSPMR
ncbi:PAB-dependent poly(A)-specific ribonuclease subunit PAN2 [Aulographum hederae CBS 113979]|uniref:PAN2-PAN3 deadenylation complex catalytic subunit PAN2 n=1 Tax=Aulographum hederae CBS 113979 TaxID=1176131 RepID=A0A6G1GMD9_9PEZI|nr:PAB-dependent poly(A)-specific ribonuclease subunit PAN2 [Aulographum hederae CBS 113979]